MASLELTAAKVEPTKETHVFIGTFRPALSDLRHRLEAARHGGDLSPGWPFKCRQGLCYINWPDELFRCWQNGHFDEEVYKTHAEMMELVLVQRGVIDPEFQVKQ